MSFIKHIESSGECRKILWGIGIYLVCLLSLPGCLDEVDLEGSGDGAGKMVIQGQLIKGSPSHILVQVSRSLDFRSRELPPPVTKAVVYLIDSQGNELLVPEVDPGQYKTEIVEGEGPLLVETGQQYRISVTTSENSRYVSTMETLWGVPEPDSVSIQLVDREELEFDDNKVVNSYVQFLIHTPLVPGDQEERTLLRWTFEAVYQVTEVFVPGPGPGPQTCYVSRSLGLEKAVVFNGNESNSDRLDHYMLVEDQAEVRFGLGYLIRVKQQSLSRNAYRYWNQVNQTVSLSGGLFESAPGTIVGNISNELDPAEQVYGYFYTSNESEITRFVRPSEVGYPGSYCDSDQNATEDACFDCTLFPFSTKEQPDGWEF